MTAGSETKAERSFRLGIDLGGTKIAGVVLDACGQTVAETRVRSPQGDYAATVLAICDCIAALERSAGATASIGIGMPGSIAPRSGLVQNANSVWLNDKPLKRDLEVRLGRPVRMANDANCFALSEATDGAGEGQRIVFGVIVGTGCGGGIVIDGRLVDGPRAIGGEWGHTPLPWMTAGEVGVTRCWCGRAGCLETWVSGSGLEADYTRATGLSATGEMIVSTARTGDAVAQTTLDHQCDRLARGLAMITNILDPNVIVLGGGLSQMPHLYRELPTRMAPYIFAEDQRVDVRPPKWGDASGVRGAAWLWSLV